MEALEIIAICIFAYLMAAVPFGKIVGRLINKVDVQQEGSSNIGVTNVFRTTKNKDVKPGLLTLVLDVAKGALPVYLAMKVVDYQNSVGFLTWENFSILLVACCALIGSRYSIWLKIVTGKFKAGKGVSVFIGILAPILGLQIWLTVFFIWLVYVVFFFAGMIISVGSFILIIGTPLLYLVWPIPVLLFLPIVSVPIIFTAHHENIKRLFRGEELPLKLSGNEKVNKIIFAFSLRGLVARIQRKEP
jgi:acyl phosphate:glycerol-3-phosphate acyltransferase